MSDAARRRGRPRTDLLDVQVRVDLSILLGPPRSSSQLARELRVRKATILEAVRRLEDAQSRFLKAKSGGSEGES